MKDKMRSKETLLNKSCVIERREERIDPAGKRRVDPDEVARRSKKQPGQDLRDPQKDAGHGE